MIFLVLLVASILLALIRGGKISNLGELKIRWYGLILLGFLMQVLIFSPYWQERNETRALTHWAYVASLLMLLIALVGNYRVPGMGLIIIGFFLNWVVILANGGYMPASPTALATAGLRPLAPGQVSNNSIGVGPDTRFGFLSDMFAIPKPMIFSNVFSIGDVLIALGAVYLIQKAMVVTSARPPA